MGVHLLEVIASEAQLVEHLQLVEGPGGQIRQKLAVGNGHLFHGELLEGLKGGKNKLEKL